MMNAEPPSNQGATTYSIDTFLDHELARIRGLAANEPDEAGKYTELFWSLVVGLSKTKDLPLVHSIDLVNDFLSRRAPEIPIPATIEAGTERMQQLQKQLATYQVDPAFKYDPSLVSSVDLWKARRGMGLMAAIFVGGLVLNHMSAVYNGNAYMAIIVLFPIIACISLAGLVDPRIFWALTKDGQNMPARYKWIGGIVALIGAGISIFLAAYYHLGR